MNIDEHLLIAIIAALVNFLFSLVLPPLLKDSKLPFSTEIKKNYECNKDIILVSTIITVVFVYISLKITPWVKTNFLSNIAQLNNSSAIVPAPLNMQPINQ